MDISGDVGRATLGYTNGSFGAEIRAGVGKRYFDNDNVEQKVSYNGNDFGLTLSQMLGGYVLTLGGDWITVAEETDTDPKAKRAPTTEERYRDLTATLVLTDGPSARKHFWSAGVNFTRHVNEMEVAGSLKNENPDSYISVVPFFNYGTPALQSEHARLMLGLNTAVPTVIQDEYIVRDTTSGASAKKNMTHVGLSLTPNVVGEVLLGESVMLFGEAAYQWEAVSYTKGENVDAGDYKVLESVADKVQATVGFRYQYKDWAACEFAFGDKFFTDTKSIFNGEGVFVSFGGFKGLKGQLVNHARSGRYAKLVGVGAVQGDFATFVRDESHANPSTQDKDNPEARGLAVVNHLVLAEALCDATVRNHRLFFGRKILPKGQIRKEVTEWT